MPVKSEMPVVTFFLEMGYSWPLHQLMHTAALLKKRNEGFSLQVSQATQDQKASHRLRMT
jgi:hypothetical protein